ncbi:MAG: hypothetical protein ACO1SX_24805 [Actinomycetota bacterium]
MQLTDAAAGSKGVESMKFAAASGVMAILVAGGVLLTGCGPKPVAYSTPSAPTAQPPMPPPGDAGGQAPQAQMPAMPPQ